MSLDDLLRHPALWRAREQGEATGRAGLPTGYAALDRCLPGGGWPSQGLVELLTNRTGIGELSLLLPALARLCDAEREGGWLAWIAPPHQPYAPALAKALSQMNDPADAGIERCYRGDRTDDHPCDCSRGARSAQAGATAELSLQERSLKRLQKR